MIRGRSVFRLTALVAGVAWASMAQEDGGGSTLMLSPTSLSFGATVGAGTPPPLTLSVRASSRTQFTARVLVQGVGGGDDDRSARPNWLSISPSGTLYTNQDLTVSVNPAGLAVGTYNGSISLSTSHGRQSVGVRFTVAQTSTGGGGGVVTLSATSLNFFGALNSPAPASQTLSVSAGSATKFTATAAVQGGGVNWLSISPSGALTTNQNLTVSVSLAGLLAGSYNGSISITANGSTRNVPVTFVVNTASTAGGGGTSYKLIGWNDLGMHCDDGQDYSVFGVLPPYNTIHAHLIDSAGKLVVAPAGYTITYQAIADPLTNTITTTSVYPKTNFWSFVSYLFPALFPAPGSLLPDVGIAGSQMPGAGNTPRAMNWNLNPADNTWVAVGIPMTNYADATSAPYPKNYFPMMRLVAKNTGGTVLATTDIVLPISDEMSCNLCHTSNTGSAAAMPAAGWVNNPNLAKDVKLNILRKHDDRFKANALFLAASSARGYSSAGLEAQSAIHPFLCASCHGSNAL